MASIQITPSGIGQTMMIAAVAVGGAMIADSIFFMTNGPSFLGYLNIAVALDERVRAVAEIAVGIMLAMFGLGLWTVQVGGIAIIAVMVLTLGNYWSIMGSRGTANQHYTTVSTNRPAVQQASAAGAATRYACPLSKKQSDWCDEDHDADGTKNRFDPYFNNKGQGMRNCRFQNYITDTNSEGCKAVK